MDLTNDDVLRILKIIDESGYNDIRLEIGDLKLHVQKEGAVQSASVPFAAAPPGAVSAPVAAAPAPAAAPARAAAPAFQPRVAEPVPAGEVAVPSPILGTFYRASSPGEKPFVEVGQKIVPDDTICLIEVMKLFNSVKAGVAGTVTKILVDNGKMVESGQVLIHVKPSA